MAIYTIRLAQSYSHGIQTVQIILECNSNTKQCNASFCFSHFIKDASTPLFIGSSTCFCGRRSLHTSFCAPYIAACLNQGVMPGSPVPYKVKTLSITKEPVSSIGGFRVLPDYDLKDMPEDYAGLILIGGMSWFSPEAELIVPLVEKAIKDKKVVGGICNASVFLAMHGFLNNVKHTSNTIDYLKQHVGERYTGDSNYVDQQAVRDGKIITANGTGQLEFCREILYALEADTAEAIEKSYLFYKNGFCPE